MYVVVIVVVVVFPVPAFTPDETSTARFPTFLNSKQHTFWFGSFGSRAYDDDSLMVVVVVVPFVYIGSIGLTECECEVWEKSVF